ncbi:nitroreductase family protein [Methanobrevibacter olleyae]|uniref:Nitroreductase n=1 Tax=Methanobrevibacter olleyae TaxID=294671 RepID=A0A126R0B3_METOL|nr:nitroreductase family protein [Methanobrevibacter olleyae]AMK15486.1 nitroreductase family protein [Methanobrevibacter olleyae]SFL38393.1 Nitroreductase [Methanobrevibacter olleyae]
MNDFLTLAEERYSVRKFSQKEISEEDLDKILRAGQVAPTAANFQPQRIFVLKTEESLNKVKSVTPFCFNAPLVLMICWDKKVSWKAIDGHDSGVVDATIAITQMMLEAFDLGIGSCWVRGYDKRLLEKVFELSENLESVALLPIGYLPEGSKPHPVHFKRTPIENMVSYL